MLAFLVGVAVLVGLVAFLIVQARRRRRELEALAASLGLSWDAHPPFEEPGEDLRGFEAMSMGRRPERANLLHGTMRGRRVRAFDFSALVGSGKQQRTVHHGVVLVEVPRGWPRLTIVPENLLHKVADALGADDIDFESQAFSDRFWVRCEDRRFAYDVLHPRAMEHLLEGSGERWEVRAGWLCLWRTRLLEPAEVADAFERALRLVELVPMHVLQTHGGAR